MFIELNLERVQRINEILGEQRGKIAKTYYFVNELYYTPDSVT